MLFRLIAKTLFILHFLSLTDLLTYIRESLFFLLTCFAIFFL